MLHLSHQEVQALCLKAVDQLTRVGVLSDYQPVRCYPIPRGGVPAAYMLACYAAITIVDKPEDADFFFDDIIDSGATMHEWCDKYPEKVFAALIDKTDANCPHLDQWVVFPWEGSETASVENNVIRLLQYIGEDVSRGGLSETPHRVIRAWRDWTAGYKQDPAEVLKVFEDGADNYDEMVVVADIPVYSKCEHHMADIFGTATIAYIPNGKIVGLSKLSRLLDVFAKRLQVQERLTSQVADALMEHLSPKGVGVVIKARHMCMESRGVCKQGHHTITSALRGVIKELPEARAEFMALVK